MRFVPLLVRPVLWGVRNRWTKRLDLQTQTGKDFVLLVFSIFLGGALYKATIWILTKFKLYQDLIYLPPAHPLGLIFMILFGMLTLTALVAAYDNLYQSNDLDLVLASPLKLHSFYVGKLLGIVAHSSWMPLILLVPVMWAFGRMYSAPLSYYFLSVFLVLPYFFFPAAFSIIVATVIARFVPKRGGKVLFFVFLAVLIGLFYLVYCVGREALKTGANPEKMLQMVSMFSLPNTLWLPSNWLAALLEHLLVPGGPSDPTLYLVLYISATFSILALSFIVLENWHFAGYTLARTQSLRGVFDSKNLQSKMIRYTPFINQQMRALVAKEFKLFTRDMTQTVQLLMLLGLSGVYLYNLRLFSSLRPMAGPAEEWYREFLFLGNFLIGGFITTALSTRFIFPSLSLEGRNFWLLQVAPIPYEAVLNARFLCWFPPIAIISVFLSCAGAVAVGDTIILALVYGLAGLMVSYGITGSAVSFSALYMNLTWEHAAQLAAGFGSLMFMLFSTLLLGLNMLPCWLIYYVSSRVGQGLPVSFRAYLVLVTGLLMLLVINTTIVRLLLNRAVSTLNARMS